jgi:hypothetical protein
MIKSRLWYEVVDLAMCWRFFKYKLVLDDTRKRFERLKEYVLQTQLTQEAARADPNAIRPVSTWELPCDTRRISLRIEGLQKDIEALRDPLKEITDMIFTLHLAALIHRLTILFLSPKPNSRPVRVIIWNIWPSWRQSFCL